MAESPHSYEALIERLSAEPAMAGLARPGAGILIWEEGGTRLAWVSQAAATLGAALADASGRILPTVRGQDRLSILALGLAPRQGTRLERLGLNPDRLAPPVTCACRLVNFEERELLVTLVVGPIPKVAVRSAPPSAPARLPDPEGVVAEPEKAPLLGKAASSDEVGPGRPVRFVWQMDDQTRFTQVSRPLAGVVGEEASGILGRTWQDVSGRWADDPEGRIADALAEGRTWSGAAVHWAVDGGQDEVPIDLAGMPVRRADGSLAGFRGFGLIRPAGRRTREPARLPKASIPAELMGSEAAEAAPGQEAAVSHETVPEPDSEPDDVAGQDSILSADQIMPPEASIPDGNWFEELRERVAASLNQQPQTGAPGAQASPTGSDGHDDKPGEPPSRLSSAERNAFREIARALGARVEAEHPADSPSEPLAGEREEPDPLTRVPVTAPAAMIVLDGLPAGVLIHRGERILHANRFLLDLTGYDDLAQFMGKASLARLFKGSPAVLRGEEAGPAVALTDRNQASQAVEVRHSSIEWEGAPAALMLLRPVPEPEAPQVLRASELDLRGQAARILELEAILDTATDGVIALDETGRILGLNRSAEALFGYDQREVVGDAITVLLAPESHMVALDYLDRLRSPGVGSLLNDGREVLGRVRQGGSIALFMTMGSVSEGPSRKFCAVLRDITAFKKAEGELMGAKRAAEEASAQKSDLLAKISHEIRTPLNAIIGFAEVMLEERFGPIGNDRYKDYLKDVHASGAHVMSLVNDLLDLAKIEAGRMDLSFTSVDLNTLASACFTLMQPQAMRHRIVMRTSFAPKLPPVVADERSIRQILLNLVSNAIKFTDAGGQVILSTALTDRGEVAFRVRDTGIGMTEKEIEAALEPFRQIATSQRRGGTGLGLPLTKALVEANRGALQIASHPREGTLVEVIFPPTRVLAG